MGSDVSSALVVTAEEIGDMQTTVTANMFSF